MIRFKNTFAITFLLAAQLTSSVATANTNDSIHILFVGNSYTYADDIPWITKQLAASAGESKNLDIEMSAPLGATLQTHWEIGEVTRRLHEGKWDFVVLQEQSTARLNNRKPRKNMRGYWIQKSRRSAQRPSYL